MVSWLFIEMNNINIVISNTYLHVVSILYKYPIGKKSYQ